MKYADVQQSIEEYFVAHWTDTAVQFDNVNFDTEMYDKYIKCSIRFSEVELQAVSKGCYRQHGMVMISVFTKPGEGSDAKLELASKAGSLLTYKLIKKVNVPTVQMKASTLFTDNNPKDGWVMDQVSCPFFYDFFMEN